MKIIVKDGKKDLVFYANSRHYDGTRIELDDPEHRQRFDDACLRGYQSAWRCGTVKYLEPSSPRKEQSICT